MTAPAQPDLEPGRVYRTRDLAVWSANPPRLAKRLVNDGALLPLAQGLFACPKHSRFGVVPPTDEELIRTFLDSAPFVFTGPDRWNALGLGSKALFAAPLVYNTKRSGTFELGGRQFVLRRVAFPESPPRRVVRGRSARTRGPGRHFSPRRGDGTRAGTLSRRLRSAPASGDGTALRNARHAGRGRVGDANGSHVTFIHDDPEFGDLLRIVAGERRIAPGLIEKDYWVTHTLWALQDMGFDVWFKGGTSLSKGFGLIERFSEDLDLKVLAGNVSSLPPVSNWTSVGPRATADRRAYFTALAGLLRVPGTEVGIGEAADKSWRAAGIRVGYPGRHLGDLGSVMKPFVLLEIGNARVTPAVRCDMNSFVHEYLAATAQLKSFDDNRPTRVRCVHPLVTLADEMVAQRQLASLPSSSDIAFMPIAGERWDAIRAAHAAIAPMFWGPRVTLDDAGDAIRSQIAETFE